jgi:predicted ArsR family transcriptional regulator
MPGYYSNDRGCDMGRYRVTIQEAAERLGVKETAVRKRIERGTLEKEKGEDGRVYVFVDVPAAEERDTSSDAGYDASVLAGYDALIAEMRGRMEDLRTQLEAERQAHSEARRLLAAALERIPPQLEAPSQEPAESPEKAEDEQQGRGPAPSVSDAQEGTERPWWRRVFGG